MEAELLVRDETLTGEVEHETVMHFAMEFVTVREIIAQRVSEEIARQKRDGGQSEAERAYGLRKLKPVDETEQIEKALQAFEAKRIIVLVNERQVESLEEKVAVMRHSVVSFLKLVPLVGG